MILSAQIYLNFFLQLYLVNLYLVLYRIYLSLCAIFLTIKKYVEGIAYKLKKILESNNYLKQCHYIFQCHFLNYMHFLELSCSQIHSKHFYQFSNHQICHRWCSIHCFLLNLLTVHRSYLLFGSSRLEIWLHFS